MTKVTSDDKDTHHRLRLRHRADRGQTGILAEMDRLRLAQGPEWLRNPGRARPNKLSASWKTGSRSSSPNAAPPIGVFEWVFGRT